MAYEKRVLVLKQIKKGFSADGSALTGAVYAERLGTELTVTLKLAGVAPVREGRYALALGAEGKTFVAEPKGNLPVTVHGAPSLRGGFAALLVFLRGGEAEPVAFGSCGSETVGYPSLLEAFGKRRAVPDPLPPNELPVPVAPNVPRAPTVPVPGDRPFREEDAAYDDEAIADTDYYGGAPRDADAGARAGGKDGGAAAPGGDGEKEDGGAVPPFLRTAGRLTYYNAVRKKLEAAFKEHPADEALKGAFPHSRWVRTEGGLLGIVYGEGIPKYLCVAVEAGESPPEEMKDTCCFVPVSPYSDEKGYFVVFQSADTGEYVTVKDA